MAEYIDKKPIVEFITKGLNNADKTKAFGYDAIEILTEIQYAPTADVVPRAEVELERLNAQSWEELYRADVKELSDNLSRVIEELESAKAEVAREIFEEIEREFCGAYWYKGYTIGRYIAELKKKYTEGASE